ncbi:hypothetical protein VP01_3370g4, partial [Puccinia sorghi]
MVQAGNEGLIISLTGAGKNLNLHTLERHLGANPKEEQHMEGSAVVGAQQEILRNFETIWIKTQMVFPSDSDSFQEANGDW